MTSDDSNWRKRRGRRPRGHDTREAVLDAAREVFSQRGYAAATVRDIASRAQVDAAMIGYWFGGKKQLYVHAVLEVPFDPEEVVADLVAGDHDTLGERIVRRFVTVWDMTSGGRFAALARSLASHDGAASALRDFLIKMFLSQVMAAINADQPALRASLCASQLIGLGMVRYVTEFEPLSSAAQETVVAAVAPNLQRYLTGDLGAPVLPRDRNQ